MSRLFPCGRYSPSDIRTSAASILPIRTTSTIPTQSCLLEGPHRAPLLIYCLHELVFMLWLINILPFFVFHFALLITLLFLYPQNLLVLSHVVNPKKQMQAFRLQSSPSSPHHTSMVHTASNNSHLPVIRQAKSSKSYRVPFYHETTTTPPHSREVCLEDRCPSEPLRALSEEANMTPVCLFLPRPFTHSLLMHVLTRMVLFFTVSRKHTHLISAHPVGKRMNERTEELKSRFQSRLFGSELRVSLAD